MFRCVPWLAFLSCGTVLAVPWTPKHGALTPDTAKAHRTPGTFYMYDDPLGHKKHSGKQHSYSKAEAPVAEQAPVAEKESAAEQGTISMSPSILAIVSVCVIGLSAAAGAVAQIWASRRAAEPKPAAEKAGEASAPRRSGAPFTLGECLAMALVPSSVPCLALLVALGMAMAFGRLPEDLTQMFEQVAGGALLITYIKELFPKVMDQGTAAAEALAAASGGASGRRRPGHAALACIKVWATLEHAPVHVSTCASG